MKGSEKEKKRVLGALCSLERNNTVDVSSSEGCLSETHESHFLSISFFLICHFVILDLKMSFLI